MSVQPRNFTLFEVLNFAPMLYCIMSDNPGDFDGDQILRVTDAISRAMPKEPDSCEYGRGIEAKEYHEMEAATGTGKYEMTISTEILERMKFSKLPFSTPSSANKLKELCVFHWTHKSNPRAIDFLNYLTES